MLGFVGRRRPGLVDTDKAGPKYLNTADTALFHKGAQLFGIIDDLVVDGAVPVIVEGPMDAIAVTLATGGRYLGVAPLGTTLTDEQARQLSAIGRDPIVATDADFAGQVAAERDFWILTPTAWTPATPASPTDSTPPKRRGGRGRRCRRELSGRGVGGRWRLQVNKGRGHHPSSTPTRRPGKKPIRATLPLTTVDNSHDGLLRR